MSIADDLAREFTNRARHEEMIGNVSKAKAYRKIAKDLESLDPMYQQPRGRVPALVIAKAKARLLADDGAQKPKKKR